MVAQKRQSAGKGGKDNGGKSSFKSAGPHKRGPYRAVCAQGGVADGGRPCGLFNGARAGLRQIRAVCGGRRGGSAVFDGCDTSQIVLWLAGHLHVNKIQETSPGPSVVNISTLDGGRYNLFDIDGGRLRVTTVDPRTGSRTAWHSAELNIKTDNR